jgi:S1-C subfamily serine protease
MPRRRHALHVVLLSLALLAPGGIVRADVPGDSVAKVRAVAADGEVKWGSAVVVAPGRLATACHVTRRAATIEIAHGERRWIGHTQSGSALHDLCVLTVEGLDLPPARLRASRDLAPGERVVAAGFEHGGAALVVAPGVVKALYPYDEGNVIRTSAVFDLGASGGGLFDDAGNLVGLLAFKARTGSDLRFALPSEWLAPDSAVAATFVPVDPASPGGAFWERPAPDRPEFLGAALRDARGPAR